jgi:hemolysin-activating ACP:hemolysin acyltransferase
MLVQNLSAAVQEAPWRQSLAMSDLDWRHTIVAELSKALLPTLGSEQLAARAWRDVTLTAVLGN